MNNYSFTFHGTALSARPSGALWWPKVELLCVSDLHLGKSERIARRGGSMLPPYESHDTLARLEAEIEATGAKRVVCLGDSFDDRVAAKGLEEDLQLWLTQLISGRDWIWIEGNHDPGPVDLPGTHLAQMRQGPLVFRHEALRDATGEISGHYHPKARLSLRGGSLSRPCFLIDAARVIMPAFGTYTGGLYCSDPALDGLMQDDARAVLTGGKSVAVPMPRQRRNAGQLSETK